MKRPLFLWLLQKQASDTNPTKYVMIFIAGNSRKRYVEMQITEHQAHLLIQELVLEGAKVEKVWDHGNKVELENYYVENQK